MLGFILFLLVQLLSPNSDEPITLAIIDEDQTTESQLLTQLLVLTIADNAYLEIEVMSAEQAKLAMAQGNLTSHVTFPKNLTTKLFAGSHITLELVGNGHSLYESYIIRELINNLARYIESAQANILTMYSYAKKVDMEKEQYEQFKVEQFMNFTMHSLAKGTLINERTIENTASSTPLNYFSMAALFILLSIWLLGLELLLRNDETEGLRTRLRLFGVTTAQRLCARMVVVSVIALLWYATLFGISSSLLQLELYFIDAIRLLIFVSLYSICYLLVIACVNLFIRSIKAILVVQVITLLFILLISGALIPTIYFPLAWQSIMPLFFSYEAFNWLIDITVEGRNYADYGSLLISVAFFILVFYAFTQVEKRWLR